MGCGGCTIFLVNRGVWGVMEEIVRVDSKRLCTVEGCSNLGDVHHVAKGVVHRRKFCYKHKIADFNTDKYKARRKLLDKLRSSGRKNLIGRLKYKGMCNKCSICGWGGPCDFHRKKEQGEYSLENIEPVCPNCHRLIHRKILKFNGTFWTSAEVDTVVEVAEDVIRSTETATRKKEIFKSLWKDKTIKAMKLEEGKE